MLVELMICATELKHTVLQSPELESSMHQSPVFICRDVKIPHLSFIASLAGTIKRCCCVDVCLHEYTHLSLLLQPLCR